MRRLTAVERVLFCSSQGYFATVGNTYNPKSGPVGHIGHIGRICPMGPIFGKGLRARWSVSLPRKKRRKIFRRLQGEQSVTLRLELQDHVDSERPLIAIRELIERLGIGR